MNKQKKFTFDEIFKQNENRIYYQLHRLGIQDPEGDFYSEGMEAMWRAYEKYQPDKGPLSTYFNFSIRNRLVDLIRKKTREQANDEAIRKQYIPGDGNSKGTNSSPLPTNTHPIPIVDKHLWHTVFSTLTEKQKIWVYYAIIQGYTLREIAEKEEVSMEAVKSWGKEARKKLRRLWEKEGLGREDIMGLIRRE